MPSLSLTMMAREISALKGATGAARVNFNPLPLLKSSQPQPGEPDNSAMTGSVAAAGRPDTSGVPLAAV